MAEKSKVIQVENMDYIPILFGQLDQNIVIMEKELNISIKLKKDNILKIKGEEDRLDLAEDLINQLFKIIENNGSLTSQELKYYIDLLKKEDKSDLSSISNEIIVTTAYGKPLKAKTAGQRNYIESIKKNPIVFGIGPAGTGKTYLAMAMAVRAFKNKEVNRIILTRPAVEAGESLGFLPGDLQEKIDPYLRPLYDALFEIMGNETYQKLQENGVIEVAPLAYMRGRTLDNSFVILDEAQNTTNEQMKMFLTRIGYGSRAIVTGDITQVDLPKGKKSGLKTIRRILQGIEGIGFVEFSGIDVVRHPLVQKIINAYEKYDEDNESEGLEKRNESFNR